MVAYAFNSSTQETESGKVDLWAQRQPGLQGESKDSQDTWRNFVLKTTKQTNKQKNTNSNMLFKWELSP